MGAVKKKIRSQVRLSARIVLNKYCAVNKIHISKEKFGDIINRIEKNTVLGIMNELRK